MIFNSTMARTLSEHLSKLRFQAVAQGSEKHGEAHAGFTLPEAQPDFTALIDRLYEDFPDELERKSFLVDALVKVWNLRGHETAAAIDAQVEAFRNHLTQTIRLLDWKG